MWTPLPAITAQSGKAFVSLSKQCVCVSRATAKDQFCSRTNYMSKNIPDAMEKHLEYLKNKKRTVRSAAFGYGKMSKGWCILSDKHPDS